MQTFPDFEKLSKQLVLQDKIANNRNISLFAMTCAANVHHDYHGVIKMIQDQLKDNPNMVIDLMGVDTVLTIDDLHGSALTSYQRWQLSKYGNILAERKDVGEWNGPVPDYRADEKEAREQNFEL